MGCSLRVRGISFDPDTFLAECPWTADAVWYRGKKRFKRKPPCEDSGFNIGIGGDNWSDLDAQIANVLAFIKTYNRELERLRDFPGVDHSMLDFGFESRIGDSIFMQGEYLPPELLRLTGALNIGIGLSIYPRRQSKED